jgi:hypothetical protein
MRIEIVTVGRGFRKQMLAYAEYRLFSSLSRFSEIVREVHVSLAAPAIAGEPVVCGVSLVLESGRRTRVRARGTQASEAIDRASDRAIRMLKQTA